MRRIARLAALVGVAAFSLLAVTVPAAAQQAKVTVKTGIAFGNETHPITIAATRWSQVVRERTNGEVDIQVFPGGQLGGEVEMLEGLRLGSLQAAVVEISATSGWVPQGAVFSLPFLFRNDDHLFAAYSGPVGKKLAAYYPPKGFRLMGFWTSGARHPMGKFKIEKPEDVVGKKMRTMQVQLHLDAWNAVGANPTPLPFPEVMNALQTGTIDYFDSIGSSYWDLKAYEVAPHMSVLGHIYAIFTVAVSEPWWQRQSAEHRRVMETTFQELASFEHNLISYYNALGPDKAAKAGATITYVKDKTPWQAKMKPLWDKWAAGVPDGKALYEEILATK
jgi:tripartite ATP-independent transporter DctP family solute receptor